MKEKWEFSHPCEHVQEQFLASSACTFVATSFEERRVVPTYGCTYFYVDELRTHILRMLENALQLN